MGYNHGKTYFTGLQKAGLLGTYTKPGVNRQRELKSFSPTSYSSNGYYPYAQRYGQDSLHRSQSRRGDFWDGCAIKINVVNCFLLQLFLGPQTFTDLAEMVAKVRRPTNRVLDDETTDSESDIDYYNDEVSNVSETYDDQELLDQQTLRQRRNSRKRSSSFMDSEIISSTLGQFSHSP